MVSTITGRTPHEEAKKEGKTYDLVANVRARRLKWLGQILSMNDDRMLKQTVQHMYQHRREGDILEDAPHTDTWEELTTFATKNKGTDWNRLVRAINDQIFIQAAKSKKKKNKGKGRNRKKKKNR